MAVFRSKELQGEAVDLRERIKHLNDMVFCQQRKVKGMIEEVRRVKYSVDTVQLNVFCSSYTCRVGMADRCCVLAELESIKGLGVILIKQFRRLLRV